MSLCLWEENIFPRMGWRAGSWDKKGEEQAFVFLFVEWASKLIANLGPVSDTGSLKRVGFRSEPWVWFHCLWFENCWRQKVSQDKVLCEQIVTGFGFCHLSDDNNPLWLCCSNRRSSIMSRSLSPFHKRLRWRISWWGDGRGLSHQLELKSDPKHPMNGGEGEEKDSNSWTRMCPSCCL